MKQNLSPNLLRQLTVALPATLLILLSLVACSPKATSQNPPANSPQTYPANTVSSSSSAQLNYQPTPGPYTLLEADNLFLRKTNGQQLPLKIYYPQAQGTFPVIIFSHGGGGSKDFYAPLGRFWASQGYISIHPTHADSISLRGKQFLRELGDYALNNSQAWKERAGDISLVIDSLNQLSQKVPSLQGKINSRSIGVGGHSFGAYTAQLVGGATIDIPNGPKAQSFADKRVKALLLLSPQGRGQQGLTATSWNALTLPVMFVTGTNDQLMNGRGPEWRREPFDFAPPGDKYLLFIKGANHFSFGGRLTGDDDSGTSQKPSPGGLRGRIRERIRERVLERRLSTQSGPEVNQEAIFDYVKVGSLAFWDAYLKSEVQAKNYLKTKALEPFSRGEAILSIR